MSDLCGNCKGSEIQMSPDAFEALSTSEHGSVKMDVAWKYVPCVSDKRMLVHTHPNTDKYWIAVQVSVTVCCHDVMTMM